MADNPVTSPLQHALQQQTLHASALGTPEAVFTLGLICARMLQQHEQITLMANEEGIIEVVPKGELELDLLPEHSALQILMSRSYTESQLESYLKGRDCRNKREVAKGEGA